MSKGPDISTYQGDVDFDVLKNNVDFVMIRASYGCGFKQSNINNYRDSKFDRNRSEARRVGLARGFYHYAYPQYNSPEEEADYFKWILGDLEPGEVIALDFEEDFFGDKVDWCLRFLTKMESYYGFKPLLYISLSTSISNNWKPVIEKDFGLWVAVWDGNDEFPQTPWPVVAMKQYTNSQDVNGINSLCDFNIFNGDVEVFKKYGFKKPIPVPDNIIYIVKINDKESTFANQKDAQLFIDITVLSQGDTISLIERNVTQNTEKIINSYTKPMDPITPIPVPPTVDPGTYINTGKDLANALGYSVPSAILALALVDILITRDPSWASLRTQLSMIAVPTINVFLVVAKKIFQLFMSKLPQ